jgi:hypothetical protein
MAFRLVQAQYDRKTLRAYVELRAVDSDGGEAFVTAIFSYRHSGIRSKQALEQDLATKARHLLRRASLALEASSL